MCAYYVIYYPPDGGKPDEIADCLDTLEEAKAYAERDSATRGPSAIASRGGHRDKAN